MSAKLNSVAVIGAGTAGICSAKHALKAGLSVTVFEQADQVGGTWVYTDQTKDETGSVHTSMYKGLHTNLPKEIMGYPDFPIPDQERSYIPSGDMLAFLKLYAKEFNVDKVTKFRHQVIRVRPFDDQWEVIVKDLSGDGRVDTYMFDAVIVCNGHYHTPDWPKMKGYERFQGFQIHSHDYRCSDPYKDDRVLVIGGGPSALDIAYEISKVAERVTLSHHLKQKPKTVFPANLTQKPDIEEITETGAIFTDGSFETFSSIVFCTGYKYTFPFLSVDCGVSVEDNYVSPLFKHVININNPTMGFIGLPFQVCASQMFDLQARFCIALWTDEKKMPTREQMQEDTDREMAARWARGYSKRQAHMMGPDQEKYYEELAAAGDLVPLKPVITKLHNATRRHYLDELTTFRKKVYKIVDDENFVRLG